VSAAIQLRAVCKDYPASLGPVRALADVSLVIPRGEMCAVTGPSGSGKTTLLTIIGALDRVTSGRVTVDGRELTAMSSHGLARFRIERVGFVFQNCNLIPVLTAAENIALPLGVRGVARRERQRRVLGLLELLGLREVAHRRPGELSGGQQQRVGIARALVGDPAFVLADEPTSHLDADTGRSVMAMLRAIHDQRRTTFVFSTHDPAIEALATWRLVLRSGRVLGRRPDCATECVA
jgi:putative ABC transport system ATP-binding protein